MQDSRNETHERQQEAYRKSEDWILERKRRDYVALKWKNYFTNIVWVDKVKIWCIEDLWLPLWEYRVWHWYYSLEDVWEFPDMLIFVKKHIEEILQFLSTFK